MRIVMTGHTRAMQQLARAGAVTPHGLSVGLREIAETVMTASKRDYVPVDTGALRASGFVDAPLVTATGARVDLGFGGPAAPYAAIVHEDLLARHPVGQAKYLEIPLRAYVQGMAAVLAMRARDAIRAGIQRLAKIERLGRQRAARGAA
jgi:hypothetical protein